MIRFNLLFSFLLCLALNYSSTNFGVGVGISCLEKKSPAVETVFYKDLNYIYPALFPNNKKVLLIHDQHDIVGEENPTIRQQRPEMLGLISNLSKQSKPVSFYLEYPFLAKNFRNSLSPEAVTHLPMRNALQYKMRNGSIQYKTFDHRPEDYFWVKDMIQYTDVMHNELETNRNNIPQEFFYVTNKSYFANLNKDKQNSEAIVERWNPVLRKLIEDKIKALTNIQSPNSNNRKHMFDVIKNLHGEEKWQFCLKHLQAQSVYSDIILCDEIIKDENPILVVHAGAYHTMQLEEKLKAIGYTDAFKKDLKNGLSIQEGKIAWPENPSIHLDEIKKFLSDSK